MSSPTSKSGQRGEQLAREYLEHHGFTFITANWSCKLGEIDLIMRAPSPFQGEPAWPVGRGRGEVRVLVEVRLRRPTSFGAGLETVGWQKQQKLLRTAKYYQQKENFWGNLRFDVVSIVDDPVSPKIEHIADAFN